MSKKEAPIIRTARLKLRRRHERDIPFMLDLFNTTRSDNISAVIRPVMKPLCGT